MELKSPSSIPLVGACIGSLNHLESLLFHHRSLLKYMNQAGIVGMYSSLSANPKRLMDLFSMNVTP